jgi:translation initiation factor 2-alpha kinase 3
MSKFFRKAPDSDTSSSASDSEQLEEEDDDYFGDGNDLATSQELEIATPPLQDGLPNAVAVGGPNKDLLLHALLEEKCLNDVRKEHAGKPTSESAIIIEARNRYESNCNGQALIADYTKSCLSDTRLSVPSSLESA